MAMKEILLTAILSLGTSAFASLPRVSTRPPRSRFPIRSTTRAVQYSSNWAGAVVTDNDITTVEGTFVVPHIRAPQNSQSGTTYGAAAWVGIDGWTCDSAILQTGVDFSVQNGVKSYQGWFEWYPHYLHSFPNFKVSPGDSVTATVLANSNSSGTAILQNLTTGKTVQHRFSNEQSAGSLCETNAEWIVEDFEVGSGLIPFADFGSVTFTNAEYVSEGQTNGLSKATLLDISQDGETLTKCGIKGGSGVTCQYTRSTASQSTPIITGWNATSPFGARAS